MIELYKNNANNYLISIWNDYDAESPREWSNLSTFLTWDRDYTSPDKNDYYNMDDFLIEFLGIEDAEYRDIPFSEIEEKANELGYFILPIGIFEHSLVKFYIKFFGSDLKITDSDISGFMFAKKDYLLKEFDQDKWSDKFEVEMYQRFQDECDQYTYYANGWCYCFTAYNAETMEEVDDCCGFIGYDHNENGISDYYTLDEHIGDFDSFNEYVGQWYLKKLSGEQKVYILNISTESEEVFSNKLFMKA